MRICDNCPTRDKGGNIKRYRLALTSAEGNNVGHVACHDFDLCPKCMEKVKTTLNGLAATIVPPAEVGK